MSADLLRIENLHASYGHMHIVRGLSLRVAAGERIAILGRNGAGKTTTILSIAGALPGTSSCDMWVEGEPIGRHNAPNVVQAGVSIVPEGHQVFPDISVRENLRLGAFHRRREGRASLQRSFNLVFQLFPLLERDQHREAGALSGGGQQMVAVGQALMSNPKCLFLDEPSSGLAPAVVDDIYNALDNLCDGGTAVVVVEQNVDRALSWARRCYVMDNGEIALEGESSELAQSDEVDRLVRGVAGHASIKERLKAVEAENDLELDGSLASGPQTPQAGDAL